MVQYSSPDGPGMMCWTTRRVSQCGQCDRTVADGNGVGSAADGGMDEGQLRLGSHRRPGLRLLPGARATLVELLDPRLCIGNRGFGIGPCEADFKRCKWRAIDDDRLQIRAPDPGVPQTLASLEAFNFETVVIAVHLVTPIIAGAEGNIGLKKHM